MYFIERMKRFASDETGAVTVDWVVLTAAIIAIGIAVLAIIEEGIGDLGINISNTLANMEVGAQFLNNGEGGNDGLGQCPDLSLIHI